MVNLRRILNIEGEKVKIKNVTYEIIFSNFEFKK